MAQPQTIVDRRLEFARKYVTAVDGTPFSLKGRAWVRHRLFEPLDSYKLWPCNPEALCDGCRSRIGELTLDYRAVNKTHYKQHLAKGCEGLSAEPQLLVALNLKRQSGKTFNTAAFFLYVLFKEHNRRIAFLAASEPQAKKLFENNYAGPVRRNAKLDARAEILGTSLTVPSTNSQLMFLTTAHESVTGDTLTDIVIDEARDVHGRPVLALLPSTFSRGGWECRECGQTKTETGINDDTVPERCSACHSHLSPWHSRIVITSSAGVMEGGEKDWFGQFVEKHQKEPDPNVYLYVDKNTINPKTNTKSVDMVGRVFGELEATKAYADVETGNVFRRKGEDFLTPNEISGIVDTKLYNSEAGGRPAVAFLDTSDVNDLTSFVITEDDSHEHEDPWTRLVTSRIDVWEPKKMPGGIIDEHIVLRHLQAYVPLFALLTLRVDDRGRPWAKRLVAICRKEPWGRVVEGVAGWKDPERRAAWSILEAKVRAKHLRIQDHRILRAELRAARVKYDVNNRLDVREASRRRRHLDVAESLACCCYLAHLEATATRGPSLSQIRAREQGSSGQVLSRALSKAKSRGGVGFFSGKPKF